MKTRLLSALFLAFVLFFPNIAFAQGTPIILSNSAKAGEPRLALSPEMSKPENRVDFQKVGYALQTYLDATDVKFAFGKGPNDVALYQSQLRTLQCREPGWVTLFDLSDFTSPPARTAPGLKVTLTLGKPFLNGKPLAIESGEVVNAQMVAIKEKRVLLATNRSLRCYNADGSAVWNIAVPSGVTQLTIGTRVPTIIAAQGDGTLRWYRLDGTEVMGFLPHTDRKRWVIWTPSGYYDCSPGGEDLIGWLAGGANDYYPASRFREKFYTPALANYALSASTEKAAVTSARTDLGKGGTELWESGITRLPPVVSILLPLSNTEAAGDTVTIKYTVRTQENAPVTKIHVLIDGRNQRGLDLDAPAPSQASGGKGLQEISVALPAHSCDVSLLAENKNGFSTPATIHLKRPDTSRAVDDALKPKLYVLAIGVGKYQSPIVNRLTYPAKDASDFAAALAQQKGGLYRDVVVKLLTNEQATRDEIVDGLDWIQKQTTSRDVAMVFLAGHGANDPNGVYHFLPYDFDPDKFKRTGVPRAEIESTLRVVAGKIFFFMDTCDSGNVLGGKTRGTLVDMVGLVNELTSAEAGVVVFCASGKFQSALEDDVWGNGAFTKALIEGLTGKASTDTGEDAAGVLDSIRRSHRVTIALLEGYIAERVKELTKGRQTPTTTKPETVPNLTIATLPE